MNRNIDVLLTLAFFLSTFIVALPHENGTTILDYTFWQYENLKGLDIWGDSNSEIRDIVAVYAKADTNDHYFRTDLMDMREDSTFNLYFAIDYIPGGITNLIQGNQNLNADVEWDLLVILSNQQQTLVDANFTDHSDSLSHFAFDTHLDYVEFSFSRASMSGWSGDDFNMQVFSLNDDSSTLLDSTDIVRTSETTGRAKVVINMGALFGALNPGIAIQDYDRMEIYPPTGERKPYGAKYLFDASEQYHLPLNMTDLRIDILPVNDYLRIDDRLQDLADKGLLDPLATQVYGHFFTWQPADVDTLAMGMGRRLRDAFGMPTSDVLYPYEWMLKAGDFETIRQAGFEAIYAGYSYYYWFGWPENETDPEILKEMSEAGTKIHLINGVKVFFESIGHNWGFVWDERWGDLQYPSEFDTYHGTDQGLHQWLRRILLDNARNPDQEKYFELGTDLQLTGWGFPDVADWIYRWLASHPWIEVTTHSNLLRRNWTPIDHGDLGLDPEVFMNRYTSEGDGHYNNYFWEYYYGGISDGHSPIVPPGMEIESYFDYIPYLRDSLLIPTGMKMGDYKTPGAIVYETLKNLRSAPDNPITNLAWLAYFMSIAEQTIHSGQPDGSGLGGRYLSPNAKVRANNMRQVNKILAAAAWVEETAAGALPDSAQGRVQDLDLDGEKEYILKNNRVFAIFENDGGRLDYGFAYEPTFGPVQLVGPHYQVHVPFDFDYEKGETEQSKGHFAVAFESTTPDQGNYRDSLFIAEFNGHQLSMTSSDNKIEIAYTLQGNTIHAHYNTTGINEVIVGFGLPVNLANLYTNDWIDKIEKVETQESLGWKVSDGGYAVVNLLDTQINSVNSFLDSPAREEMKVREDESTYPSGHWYPFPYHEVSVSGFGEFDVSLTFSANPTFPSAVEETTFEPLDWRLQQNYPNPFNPATSIEFEVATPSAVSIKIYNLLGQEIRNLVEKNYAPGSYKVEWDGLDNRGRVAASGMYLYRMKAKNYVNTKKLLLLR